MKTHKERMIIEKRKLDKKILKLSKFCDSKRYEGLYPVDQSVLSSQLTAMTTYSNILQTRIELDL